MLLRRTGLPSESVASRLQWQIPCWVVPRRPYSRRAAASQGGALAEAGATSGAWAPAAGTSPRLTFVWQGALAPPR